MNDNVLPSKILLVEDEALIALDEAKTLERYGFQITIATYPQQAIDIVNEHPVDMVLMDIDLGRGEIDGTQTAEIILEKHNLPIIFLTSHAEREYVKKVKGITRYGYVIKNSGEFVLIEAVTMAAELFHREQIFRKRNDELKTLLDVSNINLKHQNLQDTIQKTTDSIVALLSFNSSALYMLDESNILTLVAATPPLPDDLPEFVRKAHLHNHPHIAECIRSNSPIYIYDTHTVELTAEEQVVSIDRNLRTILYLPLLAERNVTGVLITGTAAPVELSDHTIDSCRSLANIASITISNAKLYAAAMQDSQMTN